MQIHSIPSVVLFALVSQTLAGGSFHLTIAKDIVRDITPSGTQTIGLLSGTQMSASLAVDSTAKAEPSSLDSPLSSPSPILPSSSSAVAASSPPITSMIPATTASPSPTSSSASPTSSDANANAPTSTSSTSNLVKIVVPAVVGGAVVLVLLTLLIVCCCGSRKRAQDDEDKDDSLNMREIPTPHSMHDMHEKRANIDSFAGSDRSYVPYHDGQVEGKHESTILPPSPQQNDGMFGGKPIVPPPVASPKFANLFNITSSRAENKNTDRNLSPLGNQVANASKSSLQQRLSARFSGAFSFTSTPSTPNNRNSAGYFEFDSRNNSVPEVPSLPSQNVPSANKPAASLAPPPTTGRHMSDPFAASNAGPVMYDNITGKVTPLHGDKHMSTQTYGSASDSDFDDGRTTMYGGRRDTQASAWTDHGLQVPSFIAEGATSSSNSLSIGSDQRQVSVASSEPLPSSPDALPGSDSGDIEELHDGYVAAKPVAADPPRDSTISIYQNYSSTRDSTMPVAETAASSTSPRRALASPSKLHEPTPSTASSTFSFYSLAEAQSNTTAGGGGITVDDRGEASMGVLEPPTPTRRPRKSEESHRSGKSARSMTPQNQGVLGWAKRAVGNRVSGLWASEPEPQPQPQPQPQSPLAPTSAPSGHKREDSFGYAV